MSADREPIGSIDDTIEFLRCWEPDGPWSLTAIKPDAPPPGKIETRTFSPAQADGAMRWVEGHQRDGRNVYYSINRPKPESFRKKAPKGMIAEIVATHVDIDLAGARNDEEEAAILDRLRSRRSKPTMIVFSGGGYRALWRFNETLPADQDRNADRVEILNKRLIEELGGDRSCFNIDRIFRLPGTVNYPSALKRGKGRVPGLAHVVEADWDRRITPALPTVEEEPKPSGGFSENPPEEAARSFEGLPGWLVDAINTGQTANSGTDRSDAVFAVACGLVRAGWPDSAIARILLDPELAISAHVRAQSNPRRCARRQVERAREAGKAEAAGTGEGVRLDDFWAYLPKHLYIFAPTREPWPAASVDAKVARQRTDPAGKPFLNKDGKEVSIAASAWLDDHRSVEQMTWAPGLPEIIEGRYLVEGGWRERAGARCFNLYIPPDARAGIAGLAGPWIDHVGLVYHDDASHIISWLAHRVQRPEEKINHAIVLAGAPGIGKDSILEPVKHAVGPWNFQEVGPKQVYGRFNGFIKSTVLRISEARDLGEFDRYAFYESMKTYTAAPPDVLRCDEKNLREHMILNVCGVVITTNYKTDAIFLPPDDRRHYVAWSDRTMDDGCFRGEYWNRLWGYYAGGGIWHVAAYLAGLDISGFDPKAPPPKTEAFWAIVDANRAPEESELADALDALGNPEAVTIDMLVGSVSGEFGAWLGDRRNRRAIPHRLERCGMAPVRNPDAKDGLWVIDGKRRSVYARKSLPKRNQILAARSAESAKSVIAHREPQKPFWDEPPF